MIIFLIHFLSRTNHFISFLLVSLIVLALFIFSLQDKTSFSPKPRNASSWATPDFIRVIVIIPLRLIDTFYSTDVTFFEDSPFFSFSKSLPVTEVLPLPIISPPIFDDVPSRPLQVYHHRHCSVVPLPSAKAHADSLPIPSASPTPALPLADNLPIALRKGNRSTSNSHPIYNFLIYHRLSSPDSAFVSVISSVSLPKNTNETLFPIQAGDRQ